MQEDNENLPLSTKLKRFLKYLTKSLIEKLILIPGPIFAFYIVVYFIAARFKGQGIVESLIPAFYILGIITYVSFVYLQSYDFWKYKLWKSIQED